MTSDKDANRRRAFGRYLTGLREARDLSQNKAARLICEISGADSVTRHEISRYEQGKRLPESWLPALAEIYEVPQREMKRALAYARGELAEPPKGMGPSPREMQPDQRISYVLRHPSSADLVSVAYLQECLLQLDEQYDTAPSTTLLGPAGQVHGQVMYLLEHATDAKVRRALFGVEAESATLMGQLVWDVSYRRDDTGAVAYLDEAVNAARMVRDPVAEGYAILRKSYVALYGEREPVSGVALAREAARVAAAASPALTGLALIHVAEGYAMTSDIKGCENALWQAEEQFDLVDEYDTVAPYYTVTDWNRLAGSCYLFLERPQRAEPLLRRTVRSLAAREKSQAIALGNLSLSLIRQRKLDEAASVMHRTIDAVELTRGGGGLNLAFTAGRELREWRNESWAQEIQDRLLALMAAA